MHNNLLTIQSLALAALVLLTACFRIELRDTSGFGGDDEYDVDTMVQEELAAGNYEEASSWLQEPGNMLFEGDPGSVQKLIDDLYAAGAYTVWFTGIEEFGGAKISASLAVELPADSLARAELFQLEADFWGTEPEADKDQQYMVFYLD